MELKIIKFFFKSYFVLIVESKSEIMFLPAIESWSLILDSLKIFNLRFFASILILSFFFMVGLSLRFNLKWYIENFTTEIKHI